MEDGTQLCSHCFPTSHTVPGTMRGSGRTAVSKPNSPCLSTEAKQARKQTVPGWISINTTMNPPSLRKRKDKALQGLRQVWEGLQSSGHSQEAYKLL